VARHLASCQQCREEVAGLAALPGLLRRLPTAIADEPASRVGRSADAELVGVLQGDMITQIGRRRRRHRWVVIAAAVAGLAAAGVGWASRLNRPGPWPPAAATVTVLHTTPFGGVTVLTNSTGFTVYWFGPDTTTASACTGSCARRWPPVPGPAAAGPGVTGHLGTISRPSGPIQATWNGHPLYTATADTAPGQARGNNLDAYGGIWHEVVLSQVTALPGPG
jgi:predicted lipoprotein with Yx(FWY)xxD motif